MPINRLNHAVLYVRDAERSAAFFADALGFTRVGKYKFPGGVFMQAPGSTNDHDLGLFTIGSQAADSAAGGAMVGMYHLAWEVDTLNDLVNYGNTLREIGSLVGATDHGSTKALYAKDPDGLEFELTWIVPADRLGPEDKPGAKRLDLDAEIKRFGGETLGGVGISRPAIPTA